MIYHKPELLIHYQRPVKLVALFRWEWCSLHERLIRLLSSAHLRIRGFLPTCITSTGML